MQVRRAESYRVMPWKNGGGATTEIMIWPAGASLDDFDWRLSMARIERDGPFSSFPGIDRTLTLLAGTRLELRSRQARRVLTPEDPTLRFAGEEPIDARVPDGPITDFNVMTRRARCRHRFARIEIGDQHLLPPGQGTRLIFLASGGVLRCPDGGEQVALSRHDCLLLDPDKRGRRLVADRPATVFFVDIES